MHFKNCQNLHKHIIRSDYKERLLCFPFNFTGFLKTDFSGKPNNFGLLDQIAALKWVRSNIEYFKGDPNGITVMGHGTGAACVQFLMLSPMAEGEQCEKKSNTIIGTND